MIWTPGSKTVLTNELGPDFRNRPYQTWLRIAAASTEIIITPEVTRQMIRVVFFLLSSLETLIFFSSLLLPRECPPSEGEIVCKYSMIRRKRQIRPACPRVLFRDRRLFFLSVGNPCLIPPKARFSSVLSAFVFPCRFLNSRSGDYRKKGL